MGIRGDDLLILEGFDNAVIERASQVLLNGMAAPASTAKAHK